MGEQDRMALLETYDAVREQVELMRKQVEQRLAEYPPERNPEHGTHLVSILHGLGTVESFATFAAKRVNERAPIAL